MPPIRLCARWCRSLILWAVASTLWTIRSCCLIACLGARVPLSLSRSPARLGTPLTSRHPPDRYLLSPQTARTESAWTQASPRRASRSSTAECVKLARFRFPRLIQTAHPHRYRFPITPPFSPPIAPPLFCAPHQVVYAIAHIRGGGEMGHHKWYEASGKYLEKKNTFTDFIDCAHALIDTGVAKPGALSCEGRSAGGLLVGNVVNMAPDVFCAAVLDGRRTRDLPCLRACRCHL